MAYADRNKYEQVDESRRVERRGAMRWWPLLAAAVLAVLLFAFLTRDRTPDTTTAPDRPATSAPATPDTTPDRTP